MERLERDARLTIRNVIAAVALDLARFAEAHQNLFDRPVARAGAIGVAFLELLQRLLVLLLLEESEEYKGHLEALVGDVADRAGYDKGAIYASVSS